MDWLQVEDVSEWLRGFGIWAILISLLLSILVAIMGVVPSLFLSGANAVVFGIVPGFLLSLIGEILGAAVSFWIYRKGARKIKKIQSESWEWHRRLNQASREKRWVALFLARITPFLPSGVITFAAAISRMSYLDFLAATTLGKAPSVAMETLVGHDLIFLEQNITRLLLSLLLIGIIFFIFRFKRM